MIRPSIRATLPLGPTCLLLLLTGCFQVQMGGHDSGTPGSGVQATPVISGLTLTPSSTTIVASWSTQSPSSSQLACGAVAGTYNITALDNGVQTTALAHQAIIEGLAPRTTYYCQVISSNSAGFAATTASAATSALPSTTPITGVTLGAVYSYNTVSAPNSLDADTFYDCHSNDGTTYFTTGDSFGVNGVGGGAMTIVKFTAEFPFNVATVNNLAGFPGIGTEDGLSPKLSGLFCMDSMLFAMGGRQHELGGPAFPQLYGTVMWSPDHGNSWNNYQDPNTFTTAGATMNPLSTNMLSGSLSTWGSGTFVMYCGDDGSLGYLSTCNQEDNANAFVYSISNEGYWNGGGAAGGGDYYYLARVPRAKIQNLNPADWQWFTGGDGSLDANWSSSQSVAAALATNVGELGYLNVQYVPALNRYLLMTFYYPGGALACNYGPCNSTWIFYEAPHPWGPWTQLTGSTIAWTNESNPPSPYNPIILNDTIWSGTMPTILFSGSFGEVCCGYSLYYATLTINH